MKFLKLLRLSALILIWYLQVQSSETYTRWIVFYEDKETGELHKCKESDYFEIRDMMFEMDSLANETYNGMSPEEIELESTLNVRSENVKAIKDRTELKNHCAMMKTFPIYVIQHKN